MRKVVIVCYAASAADYDLRLDEEFKAIAAAVQASSLRDDVELRTCWSVTIDDLLDSFDRDSPSVVHLSGHADEGILLRSEAAGSLVRVDGPALRRILGTSDPRPRLVVLNACDTDEHAEPMIEVVDCVVGMHGRIPDEVARQFARRFYQSLTNGKSVRVAFDRGRQQLMYSHPGYEDAPTLFSRAGVDPISEFILQQDLGDAGPRDKLIVTLDGHITEIDMSAREGMTLTLRARSGDTLLTIERIVSGSVQLDLDVSAQGADLLLFLMTKGELRDLLGMPILRAERVHEDPATPSAGTDAREPERPQVRPQPVRGPVLLDMERLPAPEVLAALPIFPLPNVVFLPGMVLPLSAFEPRHLELVDHVLDGGMHIGVPLLRPDPSSLDPDDIALPSHDPGDGRPAIEAVLGLGQLIAHQRLPDGRRFIRLESLGRVRVIDELPQGDHDFRRVSVEPLPEPEPTDTHAFEILKAQVERLARTFDEDDRAMIRAVLELDDARIIIYAICSLVPSVEVMRAVRRGQPLDGGMPHLRLQQRCLSAADADARVALLNQRVERLPGALDENGLDVEDWIA